MKTTDAPDTTGTDLRENTKPVGKTEARNVVFLSAFLLMALAAISFTLRHHPVVKVVVPSHQALSQTQPVNVRFKGKHSKMALSTTGYQTTGTQPGTVAAQGNYVPVIGANATFNGATQYFNGTYYLGYYLGWNISITPNFSGGFASYTGPSGGSVSYTGTSFPLTGWSVVTGGTGTAPAPTFVTVPTVPTAPGTLTMTIT